MDGCEKPQRVAICIASYRRPQGLHALLGGLDAQRFEGERPEIVLVVVDNDAEESARPVCEDARRWLSLQLRYAVEPRKGIPFARNATLRHAGDADWLAFIDDDEIPDPRWLDTLMRVQRETGADVVTGPVLPRFAEPPPAWIADGGLFEQPHYATGTPLHTAYTNNALLRRSRLDDLDRLFDERLTLGVGEDADLFERLALRGARIVWADEAIVHETVPAARANARWLLRRGYVCGTAITHLERQRLSAPRALLSGACQGAWWLLRGLLGAAFARGRAARVRSLQIFTSGIGRFAGFAGVR
jgi:GT2 family glycosyltransferase